MEKITVTIVKCDVPTHWYAECVGLKFEVYELGTDYVLCEDYDRGGDASWRHISKDVALQESDAELLRENEEINES